MTILSIQDLAIYVPDLDLDSPQAAILKAQMLAEGPKGANRPLEKKSFTENPRAPEDGIIKLSRWPIDITQTITVEVRGNFGRSTLASSTDWQTVQFETSQVDVELSQITIPELSGLTQSNFSLTGTGNYGQRPTYGHRSRRRTQGTFPYQVRVTYTAGFDFLTTSLSHEAQEIKTALASVLELQNSPFASGVKQFNVTDFMSGTTGADIAQLAVSSSSGTLMEDYLSVFKKYCPKEYAF